MGQCHGPRPLAVRPLLCPGLSLPQLLCGPRPLKEALINKTQAVFLDF